MKAEKPKRPDSHVVGVGLADVTLRFAVMFTATGDYKAEQKLF